MRLRLAIAFALALASPAVARDIRGRTITFSSEGVQRFSIRVLRDGRIYGTIDVRSRGISSRCSEGGAHGIQAALNRTTNYDGSCPGGDVVQSESTASYDGRVLMIEEHNTIGGMMFVSRYAIDISGDTCSGHWTGQASDLPEARHTIDNCRVR